MKIKPKQTAVVAGAIPMILGSSAFAANHREAPITALDHKADITDVYAFKSYGDSAPADSVTLIMCVDPLLNPGNGPNYFPFDDEILYEIKVDNDNDAQADVTFQFRFTTEQRLPNVFTTFAGAGAGVAAPANSPPLADGTSTVGAPIVPPQITGFEGDANGGLGQRQSYTVTMVDGTNTATELAGGPFYAVPANVGPRTMDYDALFDAGTYTGLAGGISTFTGTVDDPFWIDLGGAFDTLNLSVNRDDNDDATIPGVLSAAQDADDADNGITDYVAGLAVNAIAVEVPISMLQVATGNASVDDTIGVWATTSRPRITVRRSPFDARSSGSFRQVQRMGNPLINELIIGTGMKNRFSMDQPVNDAQFAPFVLDPVLARVANALYGGALGIPSPDRVDLFPLVQYVPPIAADASSPGPIADLLRLNLAVGATDLATASRLGFVADGIGFPNGRRLFDDVTDIALRVVVGGLLVADDGAGSRDFFAAGVNDMLGDGVNSNDVPYRTAFPYLANAPSGNPVPPAPAN